MIWMMGQNSALFSKGWRYHVEVILFLQSFAVERIGEHLQIPDACRQFQQGLCNVCDTSIVQLKREVTAMVQSIHQAQTESPVQSGHVITQQPSNRWVHRWNPPWTGPHLPTSVNIAKHEGQEMLIHYKYHTLRPVYILPCHYYRMNATCWIMKLTFL